MKVAIVTDSNSGISQQEAKGLGVFVLPMPLQVDGVSYLEGETLTPAELYRRMAAGSSISTSQPAPGDVMALWDRVLAKGYDQLVYIPMSSGLSNSCATAQMLAADYEGKVFVADNHRISVTQRYAVEDALALADAGCTGEEIRRELEATGLDATIYIGVETLQFLKKGGRITPAAASIATVLNLKPLLVIKGDKLDAYAKERGTAHCKKKLCEAMEKSAGEFLQRGVPFRAAAAGSFLTEKEGEDWKALAESLFPEHSVHFDPLTCSISCHVGPGAFGMAVCRKIKESRYT